MTFICRQKINFIFLIFLEILETSCFGYFGHAWLHTPNVILSPSKALCFSAGTKSTTFSPCFSGDIAKICKLLILGTFGMPGYTNPIWYYQLVKALTVYLHAKYKLMNQSSEKGQTVRWTNRHTDRQLILIDPPLERGPKMYSYTIFFYWKKNM